VNVSDGKERKKKLRFHGSPQVLVVDRLFGGRSWCRLLVLSFRWLFVVFSTSFACLE
jgi:hypothetical protein